MKQPAKERSMSLEIDTTILKDGIERSILDSYEKVYFWIESKFKEQKKENKEQTIDLSNTIIKLDKWFWVGSLCGKIDGIIHIGKESDIIPDKRGGIILRNEIQFKVVTKITFDDAIIYGAYFYNTEFHENVSFINTRFLGGANFNGSVFYKSVDFISVDISQQVDENNPIIENISGRIVFQKIVFYDKVSFINLNWKPSINFHFSDNTFEKCVEFILCSIRSSEYYCDFSNNVFNGDVLIDGRQNSGLPFNIISGIDLGNSTFNRKLKIWSMHIGSISMQNCHFNNTVNITLNKYDSSSKLDFAFSTIKSLFFIDSDLGELQGESINLSNEISFYKTLIKEDAFIFLRNINNDKKSVKQGSLNFGYANILGTITVQDSKLEIITLGKSTLTGTINIEDVDANYDCRESIAKIKNEFLNKNDIVNSLTFKAKEMQYYSEHLNFEHDTINKFLGWFTVNTITSVIGILLLPILLLLSLLPIRSFEKLREYTLLYFNRISNSFGMSWTQGISFTCLTAWVFFICINYLGLTDAKFFEWGWSGWDSFGHVWKNYLRILNVLNFNDELSGIRLNAKGETLFFLSKIFIAYGIYQTISAFRKYGK